jgi:hypothetical protein
MRKGDYASDDLDDEKIAKLEAEAIRTRPIGQSLSKPNPAMDFFSNTTETTQNVKVRQYKDENERRRERERRKQLKVYNLFPNLSCQISLQISFNNLPTHPNT